MPSKAITVLTLAWFVAVSTSCTMWATKAVTSERKPGPRWKIQSLVKTSGDTVVFAPGRPGRVVGDAIEGGAMTGAGGNAERTVVRAGSLETEAVSIPLSEVKLIRFKRTNVPLTVLAVVGLLNLGLGIGIAVFPM